MEKKARISIILLLALVTGTLFFTACEDFNKPLVPFIDYNTGSARGFEYEILTRHFDNEAEGFIAIPAGEVTEIHLDIHNPVEYDLEFNFTGTIEGNVTAQLSEDKYTVIIKIIEPARLAVFDMTLEMSFLGREMIPYEFPKMQARYFDNELYNLSVKINESDADEIHNPTADPVVYSASVPVGTPSVFVNFEVHEHAQFSINNNPRAGRVFGENISIASIYAITITVTADCGIVKDYEIKLSTLGLTVPDSVSFSAIYGYGDTPQTITIINTGTMSLTISDITQFNTTQFNLTTPALPFTIPAGGSSSFTIKPIAGLTVNSGIPYEDKITVSVAGGMPSEIAVAFTVEKADPVVTFPTSATITYGQTLSSAVFTGGSGAGTFAYDDSTAKPTVAQSGTSYAITFTPTDSANYNTVSGYVPITVNKATVTMPTPIIMNRTRNAVNINVTSPIPGATVEYAISTSPGTPTADWDKNNILFQDLSEGLVSEGTTYYIYARVQDPNYFDAVSCRAITIRNLDFHIQRYYTGVIASYTGGDDDVDSESNVTTKWELKINTLMIGDKVGLTGSYKVTEGQANWTVITLNYNYTTASIVDLPSSGVSIVPISKDVDFSDSATGTLRERTYNNPSLPLVYPLSLMIDTSDDDLSDIYAKGKLNLMFTWVPSP